MTVKVDSRSLIVGGILATTVFLVLGAASASNKSVYQLSMSTSEHSVVYARMHTGTGRIETWKCRIANSSMIPSKSDSRIFRNPSKDIFPGKVVKPIADR